MHQISGPTNVALNMQANYAISPTDGLSYTWLVTGGTIQSGQGSDTIVVLWTTHGADSVQCTVVGGAGDGAVVIIDITAG